ncbi:MAG TPA: DUF4250 domain-containing protein [Acholeplasmatales bacterium]|nr:DUF4250 domain-containing protein [Bacillota bacterium]OHE42204.1 MAG: hypothetical protein A2Y16_03510 [Tenericutes bacterium GWF2_57_13]HAQ56214.1 DUF4250 domain-containing protein [Acholeplasmatales bacterium]
MSTLLKMDPHIVLSLVNTKLRDRGKSLDGVCEELGVDKHLIDAFLGEIGYHYDPLLNRYAASPSPSR